MMKIFAHRGYSAKYPENTLVAFRKAARLPVEGVEFDVHLTKDNQIVVIHDEKIDRTSNGSGYVKDMTLEQLRKYDYGSWFSEEFAGESIPTLSEVLEVFAKTHHQINIELKSDIFVYVGLEELVLREVSEHKMLDRVIISSFDHEAVERIAKLVPNVENAPLCSNILVNLSDYVSKIPAKALHVSLPCAPRRPVREAIKEGMVVRVYTVNKTEYVDLLLTLGIEAMFTDDPEEMYKYIMKKLS